MTMNMPNPDRNYMSKSIRDAKDASNKLPAFELLSPFATAIGYLLEVSNYGLRKHCFPARAKLIIEGVDPAEAARRVPCDNWRYGDPMTYENALLRHTLAILGGERTDPESGLPHLAHIAWNAMAALVLMHDKENLPVDKRRSESDTAGNGVRAHD